MRLIRKNPKVSKEMNSKYVVTWVEIRATKGIVTVNDQMVIGLRLFTRSKRSSIYLHFDSKALAIDFIKGIEGKPAKRYECRLFSDAQMSKAEVRNKDLKIPFTQKQREEVYYI